jgi:hypothetical protein
MAGLEPTVRQQAAKPAGQVGGELFLQADIAKVGAIGKKEQPAFTASSLSPLAAVRLFCSRR